MSFKISYDSDQISGVVQGYGGMIQAKKEVKKLRDGLSGLSFIATVNNKDVTDKL